MEVLYIFRYSAYYKLSIDIPLPGVFRTHDEPYVFEITEKVIGSISFKTSLKITLKMRINKAHVQAFAPMQSKSTLQP